MSESSSAVEWRTCPKCEQTKPSGHFNKHKRQCKECRAETQRRYVERNRAAVYDRNKQWRARGGQRRSHLALYGITPEQYEQLLAAQDGVCAICKETCATGRRLAVDHDHETGVVRGLLCTRCNPGIGYFQDDAERLIAAAKYMIRWRLANGPQ